MSSGKPHASSAHTTPNGSETHVECKVINKMCTYKSTCMRM